MPVRSPRVRKLNSAFQFHSGASRLPYIPQRGIIAHQILRRPITNTARFEIVLKGSITGALDTAILNQILTEPTETVLRHIDDAVADENQYQEDEQKPDALTVAAAKSLVEATAAAGVREFPRTHISVYYGEIDITWKTDRKLVRLIVGPGGTSRLYYQVDYHDSPRGESIPVTTRDAALIADRLQWLRFS